MKRTKEKLVNQFGGLQNMKLINVLKMLLQVINQSIRN